MNKKVKSFIYTIIIMTIGLLLLKWVPMKIYGDGILFDASMHLTIAVAILYLIYLFIENVKSWRIIYFVFAFLILSIISIQRIISNAHDDVGLLLGLLLSIIAIIIPRWKEVKKKLRK